MGLTSRKRQKNQLELAFTEEPRSEAPRTDGRAELRVADQERESEGTVERLMEEISEPENLRKALKRVQRNKGAPGIDGMTVKELPKYLSAEGAQTLRGSDTGTDAEEPGDQQDEAHIRPSKLHARVDGVLSILRNTHGFPRTGLVDSPQAEVCAVEAVEDLQRPIQEIAEAGTRCGHRIQAR
jgi:hypothetical protein